jgi:hypothetical protein
MIRHHIYDTVAAPSRFNQDIPKELEDIIMKCVHKDPDSRYTTPAQMLEDLNGFKQKSGLIHAKNATLDATIVSGAVRRKQTARNLAYAAIALVLFLAAGFILYNNKTPVVVPGPGNGRDGAEFTSVGAPAAIIPQDSPVIDYNLVPDEAFKVKVWVNDGKAATYKEGEALKFHFRANKDGYIYLYHRDAAGTVKMLFPNPYSSDNKVKGGQVYTIPDSKMNFEIKVSPPFGTETLWAVASLQQMTELDIQAGEKDFRDLGKLASLGESALVTRSLDLVPKQARAEDTCTISTTEK